MCDPVWTLVKPASKLLVEVEREGDVAVTGSLVTIPPGEAGQKRPLTSSDFPLEIDILPATEYVVVVNATYTGEAGRVSVDSKVVGADPRGPDGCILTVDEDTHFDVNTVAASGA